MSTITVKNLTKAYGKQQVLKGVDFTVEEGKIFALLGSNGAGKTTTINILTTLIAADGGEADVAGFSVANSILRIKKFNAILRPLRPRQLLLKRSFIFRFIRFPPR